MAQFVIEDFANGLDLRRSHDTAPPGSLRVLNNCFINEGGEIEKRKAFLLHEALTTYANNVNRKGKVTGPYATEPADDASFFFRHHHNALPSGGGWTAGGGGEAFRPQAVRIRTSRSRAIFFMATSLEWNIVFRRDTVH